MDKADKGHELRTLKAKIAQRWSWVLPKGIQ